MTVLQPRPEGRFDCITVAEQSNTNTRINRASSLQEKDVMSESQYCGEPP